MNIGPRNDDPMSTPTPTPTPTPIIPNPESITTYKYFNNDLEPQHDPLAMGTPSSTLEQQNAHSYPAQHAFVRPKPRPSETNHNIQFATTMAPLPAGQTKHGHVDAMNNLDEPSARPPQTNKQIIHIAKLAQESRPELGGWPAEQSSAGTDANPEATNDGAVDIIDYHLLNDNPYWHYLFITALFTEIRTKNISSAPAHRPASGRPMMAADPMATPPSIHRDTPLVPMVGSNVDPLLLGGNDLATATTAIGHHGHLLAVNGSAAGLGGTPTSALPGESSILNGSVGPRPYWGDAFFTFQTLYWPFHCVTCLVICTIGIFANLTNVVVLTRPNMITAVNTILCAIACSDLIVNISNIPYLVHLLSDSSNAATFYSYNWALYILLHAHVTVTAHTISIWLTCVLATWRYFVVCSQSANQRNWSVNLAIRVIIIVIILVPIFCIPSYLSFDILSEPTASALGANQTIYRVGFSYLAEHSAFIKTFHFWVFSGLTKLLPCVLLTFFTTVLVRKLLSARERRLRLTSGNQGPAGGTNVACRNSFGGTQTNTATTTTTTTTSTALSSVFRDQTGRKSVPNGGRLGRLRRSLSKRKSLSGAEAVSSNGGAGVQFNCSQQEASTCAIFEYPHTDEAKVPLSGRREDLTNDDEQHQHQQFIGFETDTVAASGGEDGDHEGRSVQLNSSKSLQRLARKESLRSQRRAGAEGHVPRLEPNKSTGNHQSEEDTISGFVDDQPRRTRPDLVAPHSNSSCATDAECLPASCNGSPDSSIDMALMNPTPMPGRPANVQRISQPQQQQPQEQQQTIYGHVLVETILDKAASRSSDRPMQSSSVKTQYAPPLQPTTLISSPPSSPSALLEPNSSHFCELIDCSNSENSANSGFHQDNYRQHGQRAPDPQELLALGNRSASTCGALELYATIGEHPGETSSRLTTAGTTAAAIGAPDGQRSLLAHTSLAVSTQDFATRNSIKRQCQLVRGLGSLSQTNLGANAQDAAIRHLGTSCEPADPNLTATAVTARVRSIGSATFTPFQIVKFQATQRQLSQNETTTRLLIAVMILFLICEFPAGILAALCAILGQDFFDNVYQPMGSLTDLFALINSSVNFVLYCFMSTQFRITFYRVVLRCPAPNVPKSK